eukprot:XP_024448352.1 uncharacterized protein K02A2.6-like [Populus trichocarpa]
MIAKSKKGQDHVEVLRKLFERLRKYELRLNPAKCSFGVKSGKLLGFVVSDRGIEVDPDKVRAIQAMSSPKTEKEVLDRNYSIFSGVWYGSSDAFGSRNPIVKSLDGLRIRRGRVGQSEARATEPDQ